MITRIQKRKAAGDLTSASFEAPVTENNQAENLIPGPSKNPRIQSKNLDEIESSLRKEIMSDLTKILAENQKEMLKLMAPTSKKPVGLQNIENTDSKPENVFFVNTSTPIRPKTTTQKTTPINGRNNC